MPKSGNEPTYHFSSCRSSAEFIEASVWYESKRLGLALEFMAEIDRCVSLAAEHPLQFAVVREDIRRVVANRFPYSVYFRAEKHRIVVWRYSMAAEILQFCWLEPNPAPSSGTGFVNPSLTFLRRLSSY